MGHTTKNHYVTLGVPQQAAAGDIKSAYRKLALKWHPDKNKNDKNAEEMFKKVAEAYATLSKPESRTKYDIQLAREGEAARNPNPPVYETDYGEPQWWGKAPGEGPGNPFSKRGEPTQRGRQDKFDPFGGFGNMFGFDSFGADEGFPKQQPESQRRRSSARSSASNFSAAPSFSLRQARDLFDAMFDGVDPFEDFCSGTSVNGEVKWDVKITKIKRADGTVTVTKETSRSSRSGAGSQSWEYPGADPMGSRRPSHGTHRSGSRAEEENNNQYEARGGEQQQNDVGFHGRTSYVKPSVRRKQSNNLGGSSSRRMLEDSWSASRVGIDAVAHQPNPPRLALRNAPQTKTKMMSSSGSKKNMAQTQGLSSMGRPMERKPPGGSSFEEGRASLPYGSPSYGAHAAPYGGYNEPQRGVERRNVDLGTRTQYDTRQHHRRQAPDLAPTRVPDKGPQPAEILHVEKTVPSSRRISESGSHTRQAPQDRPVLHWQSN